MRFSFYYKGTVLILVLIITTLITVVVTAAMRDSLSHVQLLSRHQESIQADQITTTAIYSILNGMNKSMIENYITAESNPVYSNTLNVNQKTVRLMTYYIGVVNDYYIFRTQASTAISDLNFITTQGWRVNKEFNKIETTDWQMGS